MKSELRDVTARIQELSEQRVATLDQRRRMEIRAPQSGQVIGLSVHTEGGVIKAGQAIMNIVPQDDKLVVDVNVEPQDIDKVSLRSLARIRFSAFNMRTTPEIDGEVIRISGDRLVNDSDRRPYYLVRIGVEKGDLAKLGGLTLVPGMPVEAFIRTGKRTALSYLTKPLRDAFARSFREE